jgi:hypothetical protein
MGERDTMRAGRCPGMNRDPFALGYRRANLAGSPFVPHTSPRTEIGIQLDTVRTDYPALSLSGEK